MKKSDTHIVKITKTNDANHMKAISPQVSSF